MLRFEESIYKRVAVFHGFIQPEQLEECLEEERAATERVDLGQLLLKKGYLTEKQLQVIREIRRKKARKLSRNPKEILQTERSFGQIALQRGLIKIDQLEKAILEQERLRRIKLQFRLGEVLVMQRIMHIDDVLDILAEQKKRVLLCTACDDHYAVYDYRADEKHYCNKCGAVLTEPLFLDMVGVDGVIDVLGAESSSTWQ